MVVDDYGHHPTELAATLEAGQQILQRHAGEVAVVREGVGNGSC